MGLSRGYSFSEQHYSCHEEIVRFRETVLPARLDVDGIADSSRSILSSINETVSSFIRVGLKLALRFDARSKSVFIKHA